MKKILILSILALVIVGCESSTSTNTATSQYTQDTASVTPASAPTEATTK